MNHATTPTSIGRALAALGDEWSLLIVRAALWGAERFGAFREQLGISESVLSTRLANLVDFEVLTTTDDGRYLLTDSGRQLWRVLAAIWSWERTWVPGQDRALPIMWHQKCRNSATLEVRCAACGERCGLDDLALGEMTPDAFERSLPPGTRRRRRSGHRSDDPHGLGHYGATMTLIGSRWSAAHLGALIMGARRFSEVQRLTGATPNVVSERLGAFVELGAVTVRDGRYELTAQGDAFFVVVAPFVAWALTHHLDPDGPPFSVDHLSCGAPFVPALTCSACGDAVEVDDLRAVSSDART